MRYGKALFGAAVVAAMVAAPLSSASAHWRHGGPVRGLFGAVGAVVVGAATIATAPLAIIAGAGPREYGGPGAYYGGPGYGAPAYGPAYGPYGPPRRFYRRHRYYYGPPPGY